MYACIHTHLIDTFVFQQDFQRLLVDVVNTLVAVNKKYEFMHVYVCMYYVNMMLEQQIDTL